MQTPENNPKRNESKFAHPWQWLELLLESLLFHSRWFLAPLYFGLVIALVLLDLKFLQELWHIVPNIFEGTGSTLILAVLSLVDLVLITNLLLMIIFSGYENFVSKIDMVEDHIDRPEWMGKIDYTAMKLKVIGSIVAISSIELLKAFINIHNLNKEDVLWMVVIHITFIVSGVCYAWMEQIYHSVQKTHD
jgi:uncharacterized protein (TIGR00645 family)